jgi:hypothetical protein
MTYVLILSGGGFILESPSTAASTQETAPRKRSCKTPYIEHGEEHESSDSEIPLSQTLKRPRQSSSNGSDKLADASTNKQASTVPKHVVEVQIQNELARMEDIASRTIQHIDSSIQREQGRASMTPEVASASIEGLHEQETPQYQNPGTFFAPQTAQSSKAFATQLLNENQVSTKSSNVD